MSQSTSAEPFPAVSPNSQSMLKDTSKAQSSGSRRRRGSSLHGEPRGDTDGPALATIYDRPPNPTNTPSTQKDKSEKPHRGRKRRKVKSLLKRFKSTALRHTWLTPLIVCLFIVILYAFNPSPSNPVHAALFLSYPLPRKPTDGADTPIQYGKGTKDFAFVAFYTMFLSFTREFLMQRLLRPLAIRAGLQTRGKQSRFMEQAYTAIYFGLFGPFGLYVMSRTPVWYFNTAGMFEGFPHKTHEALFKGYYLMQASYWAQQMIVLLLMLEKPRKDFKELVAHHVITLSLIYLSYSFHFTYMGLAVYITHDISDFFLATSKLFNYIQSPIVVPYFVVFLCSWAYLRHYINLCILAALLPLPMPFSEPINMQLQSTLSTISNTTSTAIATVNPLLQPLKPLASIGTTLFPSTAALFSATPKTVLSFFQKDSTFATVGPYTLNWVTQQYKCWISQWITFSLLMSLQAVNIFWFFLILRILWRLVASWGDVAEDVRSEDSDEVDAGERKDDLEKMRKQQGALKSEAEMPEVQVNGIPVGGDEAVR